jgi:ABC-type sugar transport system ATPase subunit
MTALARALSRGSPLLILDEPTAALTDAETAELFAVIGRLRARGTAILYVSHRLEEVFEIADRYTVLRNGRRVASGALHDTTVRAVIGAMAGRPIDAVFPSWSSRPEEVVLRVDGLGGRVVRDLSFEVRAGEVVGVAGLAGSGRSELMRILGGASRPRVGRLLLDGRAYAPRSPGDALRAGVAGVPQDRRAEALVPDTVERNLNASTIDRHARWSAVMVPARERAHAGSLWDAFDIRGHGLEQDVLTLSGGNQQKVVLAGFLAVRPRMLLLDEPTRGVDVSTKSQIYRLIRDRAAAGCGVLLVSSELPEILGLCDRVLVLHEGRVAGRFDRGAATEEELLRVCYGRPA